MCNLSHVPVQQQLQELRWNNVCTLIEIKWTTVKAIAPRAFLPFQQPNYTHRERTRRQTKDDSIKTNWDDVANAKLIMINISLIDLNERNCEYIIATFVTTIEKGLFFIWNCQRSKNCIYLTLSWQLLEYNVVLMSKYSFSEVSNSFL